MDGQFQNSVADKIAKAMEQELFGALAVPAESLNPAAELRGKPLTKEEFEEFKRKWLAAIEKPGKIIIRR